MKAKHQRLTLIIIAILCLGVAVGLILNNFNKNLVFFYSPTQLKQENFSDKKIIRIGGLVKETSVNKIASLKTEFVITDNSNWIKVYYEGMLPNLFREGQGMVARGYLNSNGVFVADNLLAKHDENYMPPEVARALKESGQWKPKETNKQELQ